MISTGGLCAAIEFLYQVITVLRCQQEVMKFYLGVFVFSIPVCVLLVRTLGINGAVGWVAGYPNAIPASTVELYTLATSGNPEDWKRAHEIYTDLHPLLRWDSKSLFVQAIKLSQQVAGVAPAGITTRPPRLPLPEPIRTQIIADTEAVLAKGYR